jgi:hypothetical protein
VRQELAAQWDTNERLLKLLQQQEGELKEQRETVKRLEGLLSHMTMLYQKEVEESKALRGRLRKQFQARWPPASSLLALLSREAVCQEHSQERLHLRAQSWQALNSLSATAEMVMAQSGSGSAAAAPSAGAAPSAPSAAVGRQTSAPSTPSAGMPIPGTGTGADPDRAAALFGHSLPYVANLLSQLGQSPQLEQRLSRSVTVHAPRSTWVACALPPSCVFPLCCLLVGVC